MRVKGWELEKNSPYEFVNNALIKRADTKDCKGEKEPKGDPARKSTSRKAPVSRGDDAEQE